MPVDAEWSAIGSWSMTAMFQLGAIAKEIWEAWKKRKPITGYVRVVKGETANGWRRVVVFRKPEEPSLGFYALVRPSVTQEFENCAPFPGYSVDVSHEYPLPDGRQLLRIRRYSLIRAANTTLLNVPYRPEEWENTWTANYGSSGTICAILRGISDEEEFCVILTDSIERRSRVIKIAAPEPVWKIWLVYFVRSPKPRLHLIFQRYHISDDGVRRVEFVNAKYDYSFESCQRQPIHPLSSESISVLIGNRFLNYFIRGPAQTWVFCQDNVDNTDAHLCISFGHAKMWRVESLTQWLTSMRDSRCESSILEAMTSIDSMSPPEPLAYLQVPAIRCLSWMQPFANVVYYATAGNGLFLRWLSPPSLKWLAAKALFLAKSDLKMAELKKGVGFDVDDGIPSDGDEDDSEMFYL